MSAKKTYLKYIFTGLFLLMFAFSYSQDNNVVMSNTPEPPQPKLQSNAGIGQFADLPIDGVVPILFLSALGVIVYYAFSKKTKNVI